VVIRLKVPIEMHYTVIPMGTSKVNSSQNAHCCPGAVMCPDSFVDCGTI